MPLFLVSVVLGTRLRACACQASPPPVSDTCHLVYHSVCGCTTLKVPRIESAFLILGAACAATVEASLDLIGSAPGVALLCSALDVDLSFSSFSSTVGAMLSTSQGCRGNWMR